MHKNSILGIFCMLKALKFKVKIGTMVFKMFILPKRDIKEINFTTESNSDYKKKTFFSPINYG